MNTRRLCKLGIMGILMFGCCCREVDFTDLLHLDELKLTTHMLYTESVDVADFKPVMSICRYQIGDLVVRIAEAGTGQRYVCTYGNYGMSSISDNFYAQYVAVGVMEIDIPRRITGVDVSYSSDTVNLIGYRLEGLTGLVSEADLISANPETLGRELPERLNTIKKQQAEDVSYLTYLLAGGNIFDAVCSETLTIIGKE